MEQSEKVTFELSYERTAATRTVILGKWCPRETARAKTPRKNQHGRWRKMIVKGPGAKDWRGNITS